MLSQNKKPIVFSAKPWPNALRRNQIMESVDSFAASYLALEPYLLEEKFTQIRKV